MEYKHLTVPNDCEHNLIIYLGIQKGAGSRPDHVEGKCLRCGTGTTIKEEYQEMNLFKDYWKSRKPIYSKR